MERWHYSVGQKLVKVNNALCEGTHRLIAKGLPVGRSTSAISHEFQSVGSITLPDGRELHLGTKRPVYGSRYQRASLLRDRVTEELAIFSELGERCSDITELFPEIYAQVVAPGEKDPSAILMTDFSEGGRYTVDQCSPDQCGDIYEAIENALPYGTVDQGVLHKTALLIKEGERIIARRISDLWPGLFQGQTAYNVLRERVEAAESLLDMGQMTVVTSDL